LGIGWKFKNYNKTHFVIYLIEILAEAFEDVIQILESY